MTLRRFAPCAILTLFVAAAPALAGQRYATQNFIVDAPTKELAKTFGEYAEKYRREKALDWLGYEMPTWSQKCPLRVQVTMNRTGGATTFTFGSDGNGRSVVTSREMHIFGETRQLLNSVLPHEVTHTVLAHHFGRPVPRWADEGGSVLSENDEERFNHDIKCREILNAGRGIPLRVLFTLREYPKDMLVVYAQGYSVCQYLIDQGGKKKFLQFVNEGMRSNNRNWEEAVKVYGYNSTDALQEAWISALRSPPQRVAARNGERRGSTTALTSNNGNVQMRTSAISSLPQLEPPVMARGAAPERDDRPTRLATSSNTAQPPPIPRLLPPEPPSKR